MLDGVEAHGLFGLVDVVITGYFAAPDQVRAAAAAIDRLRAADRSGAFGPAATVIVDPIMGDAPDGLYVQAAVAEAIAAELLPRADLLTPNLWELRRLTGTAAETPAGIAAAARTLGRPVLVTSVPAGPGEIGALLVDADQVLSLSHARIANTPNGTGDVVAAVLAAETVLGRTPAIAAEAAIRAVAECAFAAAEWGAPELPIVALGPRLRAPTAEVRVGRLAGSDLLGNP
jgi:pyridoxine kinase